MREEGRKEHKAPGAEAQTYAGYWAFGQILAADPSQKYSAWFMATIGRDMIDWDRAYLKKHHIPFMPRDDATYGLVAPMDTKPVAGSPDIAPADPIAALMTLASSSREAAQVLLRPGDTLKYLIKERKSQWGMGDRGESLGAAMEAAMKGSDPDSKRLVVLATQHIADEVKPHVSFDETGKIVLKDPSGLDKLAGIRGSMGRVLAEHSGDIASAFYKRYPRGSGGELTSTFDGRTVAEFGAADLDLTLLDIAGDDRAYQSLLMGQLAHMRGRVDEEVAKGKEGKLGNAITESSKSLGHLLKARELALVGRGKETDAADAAFKKMVDEGIGHIPLPFAAQVGKLGMKTIDAVYETFVKDGYAKAGEWLVKQAGRDGGKTDKALGDTSTNRLAVDELLKQMMESSLVTHGHYEREELKGRFVVGDPPRIKDPRDMTRNEYSAFVEWMKSNSDVPTHFGDAQESLATGMTESETNIGVPEPEKKAHG